MAAEKRRHVVIVDTREPAMVKQAVQAQLPDEIELLALPEGDFAIPDRDDCLMGIERKRVSDFLASLEDGRLSSQILRMSHTYTIQGVVIEGRYTVTGDGYLTTGGITTRWSHTAVQMALFSMQRQFPDLFVLWSNNLGTTAEIIRALAQRGYKGCFDDTSLFRGVSEGTDGAARHHNGAVDPDSFYPARRSIYPIVAPALPARRTGNRRPLVAPGSGGRTLA